LELEQIKIQQLDNNAGWVLIDFPQSYAQAKLLEQALSGYIPKEELKPT
jgi:adenylate kinase family enzyme